MKVVFVSNYINHHQLPFCQEMDRLCGGQFLFVEQEEMADERKAMGWAGFEKPAFVRHPSNEEEWEKTRAEILSCDVLMIGGDGIEAEIDSRLKAGKPVVRVSERIYREGQWKRFSPRGLIRKYGQYVQYRNAPYYLLCAGGYTASDFSLIGAYPEKMYRWGYFPPLRVYDDVLAMKSRDGSPVRLLFCARLIPLKHPEFAVRLAGTLSRESIPHEMTIIGDGPLRKELEEKAAALPCVRFTGALAPEKVRDEMEKADIFLFASDHLEGWGAVVGEAMNSGCAVLSCAEPGVVPTLIRHGETGLIAEGCEYDDFEKKALRLAKDAELCRHLGLAAYESVVRLWNPRTAAERFYDFCRALTEGRPYDAPPEGPMSKDPAIRPFVRPTD